ncbi:hypothetical protein BDN67DRAFT_1017829 [Paxillus ammoniavirescens]|nr:hypothetical protein BDN67DRAFT_1017829 [Paxillus ammoniavirescens]
MATGQGGNKQVVVHDDNGTGGGNEDGSGSEEDVKGLAVGGGEDRVQATYLILLGGFLQLDEAGGSDVAVLLFNLQVTELFCDGKY